MERTRQTGTQLAETFILSAAYFLASLLSHIFMHPVTGQSVIWLPNAIFLAFLLRTDGRNLGWNASAVWVTGLAAYLLTGSAPLDGAAFSSVHILEILTAYSLLSNLYGRIHILERLGQVFGLVLYAALLPAAVGAIAAAGYQYFLQGLTFEAAWVNWWFTAALGLLAATPLLLSWSGKPLANAGFSRTLAETVTHFAFSVIVIALVFLQEAPVYLYLTLPPLLIAAIRLDLFVHALVLLICVLLSCYLTISGNGPFWVAHRSDEASEVIQSFQFFLGTIIVTTLMVSAIVKELRDAQAKLQTNEKRLDEAHELLQLGNWEWNFITNKQHWDDRLCRVFGLPEGYPGSLEGLEKILHEDDRDRVLDDIRKARVGATSIEHQFRIVRPDGRIRYLRCAYTFVTDKTGRTVECHGTCRDITHEKRTEEQFREQAYRDPLTGLPNRAYLNNRLAQAVARGERHGFRFSVMMLDLDYFKQINDLHGHGVGDQVLVEVGKRLSGSLRINDTVTRLGGDEFTIIVEETCDREGLTRIADKIIHNVSQPILVDNVRCVVGVSIGCAAYPENGHDENTLLERADKAMYQVKRRGRNGFEMA